MIPFFVIIIAAGLIFESKSRQTEIMVYNVSVIFEVFINIYFKLNTRRFPLAKSPPILIKSFAPLLFGISSAAYVWARENSESLKPAEKALMSQILPIKENLLI